MAAAAPKLQFITKKECLQPDMKDSCVQMMDVMEIRVQHNVA
jgi:hypothetical protein